MCRTPGRGLLLALEPQCSRLSEGREGAGSGRVGAGLWVVCLSTGGGGGANSVLGTLSLKGTKNCLTEFFFLSSS